MAKSRDIPKRGKNRSSVLVKAKLQKSNFEILKKLKESL